jgi:cation:H+ antiporter
MLVFLFVLGLATLAAGAEFFVRGASRLATLLGISPLIIGLTVVAFGTSAPEVAVTVSAGLQGQNDIAFGNIVGSNISNFLLILGITALVAPLTVSQRLVRLEVPLLLSLSLGVFILAYDGVINRAEGLLLTAAAVVYTVLVVWQCLRENGGKPKEEGQGTDDPKAESRPWLKNGLLLAVGLAGLVVGSQWLVTGATGIARLFGVSELVIGLTMVALGTSLPELATSIAAAIRGERDLVIGNVIGSNLFNLTFVLGLAALIPSSGVPVPSSGIAFDLPVMLAVTAGSVPVFFSGYRIGRREGLMFVSYYVAYVLYLLLNSVEHDLLPAYSTFMMRYIIPLTILLLLFTSARYYWVTREPPEAASSS